VVKLHKSVQKYAAAHKALAAAGSELAHDFLELYDKDPKLKKLAVELEAINEYMVCTFSQVVSLVGHIVNVIGHSLWRISARSVRSLPSWVSAGRCRYARVLAGVRVCCVCVCLSWVSGLRFRLSNGRYRYVCVCVCLSWV
jgi:hypothetical protein